MYYNISVFIIFTEFSAVIQTKNCRFSPFSSNSLSRDNLNLAQGHRTPTCAVVVLIRFYFIQVDEFSYYFKLVGLVAM